MQKSVGPSAGLRFEIAANGAAHAPVFRATIVIPGAGGMMGDLVGRADAANKKTAEKMAVSLYIYIYVHIYICMYVCLYVCVCVCVCVCM
jgi:hypothetical protein